MEMSRTLKAIIITIAIIFITIVMISLSYTIDRESKLKEKTVAPGYGTTVNFKPNKLGLQFELRHEI